jgi:hypothetical protein
MSRPGRKERYNDRDFIAAIEAGHDSLDGILVAMDMKHKTTLVTRLRRLRDEGRIVIIERKHPQGFIVLPKTQEG